MLPFPAHAGVAHSECAVCGWQGATQKEHMSVISSKWKWRWDGGGVGVFKRFCGNTYNMSKFMWKTEIV